MNDKTFPEKTRLSSTVYLKSKKKKKIKKLIRALQSKSFFTTFHYLNLSEVEEILNIFLEINAKFTVKEMKSTTLKSTTLKS